MNAFAQTLTLGRRITLLVSLCTTKPGFALSRTKNPCSSYTLLHLFGTKHSGTSVWKRFAGCWEFSDLSPMTAVWTLKLAACVPGIRPALAWLKATSWQPI